MVVDTNIFIDFLNGHRPAADYLKARTDLCISVVAVAEVAAGFTKKSEINKFHKFLESAQIPTIHINEQTSLRAYELFCRYFHSTNLTFQDSLIAAAALTMDQPLATLNIKHFRVVPGLELYKPYSLQPLSLI